MTTVSTATWDGCVGSAKWLREPLQRVLSYTEPLPVQQAVIPAITRALLSGVPNDVSLTAPTGSGKTLCYLLPLLRLLTETKKGVDDNALRCLILVPTQSLGQQVHRELQRLTRPTSIRIACICTESSDDATAAEVDAAEARELVRRVVLPRAASGASSVCLPTAADDAQAGDDESASSGDDEVLEDDENDDLAGGAFGTNALRRAGVTTQYYSNTDVIVATPQRLLHHLDHTRGLRLVDLKLMVIDEADQVLAGSFASQVQKVNTRYEYEVQKQRSEQQRRQDRVCAALAARMGTSTDGEEPECHSFLLHPSLHLHGSTSAGGGGCGGATMPLHKVLCSATLSSRIARISQVKLRNCSYYVLDSNGEERKEEGSSSAAAADGTAAEETAKLRGAMTLRTQFALPPTLQEHIIFVDDAYRPAVLLKLIHSLRERIAAAQRRSRAKAAKRISREEQQAEGAAEQNSSSSSPPSTTTTATVDYPNVEDRAGTGILVFCATAEEARVMSHFLAAAGVTSVVEFTTLSSEAERRRALLQRSTSSNNNSGLDEVSCVVASDALMRGIDIPNVGHVIMYHPPDAVSQYVHRAGRTARAMRPGHVHLLLSKTGPSGSQEDGEMALYKRLSQSLLRTLPVSYERLFFRFAEDPTKAAATSSPSSSKSVPSPSPRAGTAEWWVEQANLFLVQSQHQLQRRWASVLESAAAVAAAEKKEQHRPAVHAEADRASKPSPSQSTGAGAAAAKSASAGSRKRPHKDSGKSGAAAASAPRQRV